MVIYRSLAEATGALAGCAVAIGNFDGVHVGHRQLLAAARNRAAPGSPAVALTFEPHPARALRPSLAPPLLTPLARKLELLSETGIEAAVVQPFDLAYAASDAETFVDRDLAGHLRAAAVVVGRDFTAGRGRTPLDGLRPLLAARAIALEMVEPVAVDGMVASSTKVRELLLEGQVAGAAELLGRFHDVEGVVERGAGRGRAFGFATANLAPEALLPARGVYAVRARLGGSLHGGVCNVGVKPTVQTSGEVNAETHLFDLADRDLYGETLRVEFLERLRPERRFESIDALRAQIGADAERARALLAPLLSRG